MTVLERSTEAEPVVVGRSVSDRPNEGDHREVTPLRSGGSDLKSPELAPLHSPITAMRPAPVRNRAHETFPIPIVRS